MKRALVVALALSLALSSPAGAKPVRGLHMGGPRVQPIMWTWATDASHNVPLPNANFTVWSGDPYFAFDAPQMMFLPKSQDGWTGLAIHGLFLHELGHAYDYTAMTPARRNAFRAAAGTDCNWYAKRCVTARWISGPGVFVNVPPGEMFAEMYAACALGLTRVQVEQAGYNTYGWVPPDGTDEAALCNIIRGT